MIWKLSGETVDMDALQKIRSVADYQFGKNTGIKLFPDTVKILYSKNTGKIRHIHLQKELLATLKEWRVHMPDFTTPGYRAVKEQFGLEFVEGD